MISIILFIIGFLCGSYYCNNVKIQSSKKARITTDQHYQLQAPEYEDIDAQQVARCTRRQCETSRATLIFELKEIMWLIAHQTESVTIIREIFLCAVNNIHYMNLTFIIAKENILSLTLQIEISRWNRSAHMRMRNACRWSWTNNHMTVETTNYLYRSLC